jgi:MFS transporter, ACS family, aldohexuronate transporter
MQDSAIPSGEYRLPANAVGRRSTIIPSVSQARWWVLALLFFATTINYLDRIVFSVLSPVIRTELGFKDLEYGYITSAFQFAYTAGFLLAGKFIDHYGTKIGYAVSIAWWSLAAGLHVVSRSALGLGFWRTMLGLGEAGNFPAAIKAVAEWFPQKDRAFATGVFNAGSNVAAMVGTPVFVYLSGRFGWRACFVLCAALGFVWLVAWVSTYRKAPKVEAIEESEPKIGWLRALEFRQTWGFVVAKFLTDPVWWFYLYWLPPYLYDVRKFKLTEIAWALPVIYLMADVGSVGGGWISGYLIRRGWPHGKARKAAMTICACAMPIGALCVLADDPILAVALISVATAAHQGWSANLFTTTSDVFPKNVVASVTGVGGFAGGLGGFLFSGMIPGYVVTYYGYTPVFLTMGCFHLIALFWVHRLMGKMQRLSAVSLP